MFSDYDTNWMGIVSAQWALGRGTPRANKVDQANWRMSQMASQDTTDQVEREVEGVERTLLARRTSLSRKRCFGS